MKIKLLFGIVLSVSLVFLLAYLAPNKSLNNQGFMGVDKSDFIRPSKILQDTSAIKRLVLRINQDTGYLVKTLNNEEFLEQMTDGGGILTGRIKNGKISKIQEQIFLSYCVRVIEYYFWDEQLCFISESEDDFHYNDETGLFEYDKIQRSFEAQYYFADGVLFQTKIVGQKRFKADSDAEPNKDLLVNLKRYISLLDSGRSQNTRSKQKANELKRAYQNLSASPHSTIYQQEYFVSFPNSFMLFNHLFGYSDKEPLGNSSLDFEASLYKEADAYIQAFFNLTTIEKSQHYQRMIEICINGKWNADGVNYFQQGVQKKLKSDTDIFLELLSKRSDEEIKAFWYFYFDNPHPTANVPKELQKIKQTNSRIYNLMELSLKEVHGAWEK